MLSLLSSFISSASTRALPREKEIPVPEPTLFESVELARKEWQRAREYFNFVTDPDLVDMAIYSIEAAEKKYMYLLKTAREQGTRINGGVEVPEQFS